tara:strand:+ start:1315 stop:1518 length:204 start_codon:yes stop_codon:yes gene_type:complete
MIRIIKDIYRVFKSGKLGLMRYCASDTDMINAVKELNQAVDEDERLLQKAYGKEYKLQRYRLIDWFI